MFYLKIMFDTCPAFCSIKHSRRRHYDACLVPVYLRHISFLPIKDNKNLQGRNHWGLGVRTPKIWMDYPDFFDEECDYRYVTDCSPRNWVYHPYFVLYNNLTNELDPNFENVVAPLKILANTNALK